MLDRVKLSGIRQSKITKGKDSQWDEMFHVCNINGALACLLLLPCVLALSRLCRYMVTHGDCSKGNKVDVNTFKKWGEVQVCLLLLKNCCSLIARAT